MKKKILHGNIGYGMLMVLVVIVMMNSSVKSALLSGMMKVGLFRPDVVSNEGTSDKLFFPAEATFLTSQGNAVSTAQLKGKVLFINFWATWCPPCIAEMPSIDKLQKQFKGNPAIVFMAVVADRDLQKSEKFMKDKGYSLPVYALNSPLPAEILSGSIPTTVIVNKEGEVVFRNEGAANYNTGEVVTLLRKLSK